jgi:tetratricopeptide (TPR) repeat protein
MISAIFNSLRLALGLSPNQMFWPVVIGVGILFLATMILYVIVHHRRKKILRYFDHVSTIGKFFEKRDYRKAEEYSRVAQAFVSKAFGENHFYMGEVLFCLAMSQQGQARFSEAESILKRAYAIYSKTFGTQHPLSINVLEEWAYLNERQGKYDEAKALYRKAIGVYESTGRIGPKLGICLNHLAAIFHRERIYEETEKLAMKALGVWAALEKHSQKSADISPELLLELQTQKGKLTGYGQEDEFLFKTMNMSTRKPDFEISQATTLFILSDIYFEATQFPAAEERLREALRIWEKKFGRKDLSVASILNRLGAIAYRTGQHEKALSYLSEALQIREAILGSEHSEVVIIKRNIELCTSGVNDPTYDRPNFLGDLFTEN